MIRAVNDSNRIWGTVAILIVSIIGCIAGVVFLTNQEAKIEVRRARVVNIDMAIRAALNTAKVEINKNHLEEDAPQTSGGARVYDAKAVRLLLEKQTRVFTVCEEEIAALHPQRLQNEAMIYDLMDSVNEYTILTVVCAILGFYSVFWLQRYT
jgi:hypothetical protein